MRTQTGLKTLFTLTAVALVLLMTEPGSDSARADDRLPNTINWQIAEVTKLIDVTKTTVVQGSSVAWTGTMLADVKKFKGLTAKILDEDTINVCPPVRLKFQPDDTEYKKGDKVTITLELPAAKFKTIQTVTITRN